MTSLNSFETRTPFADQIIYRLKTLVSNLASLPFTIRILLESLLRHEDGQLVTVDDVQRLAQWGRTPASAEIPFLPARIIMQDFTGGACLADLAAMREAVHRLGRDPQLINPLVPVDLVIDHTVSVDYFGTPAAAELNTRLGYERNRERYEFFKWSSRAFKNLRVVPPARGIIHQVNLEYLASGIISRNGELFPDTVVGTDSHTPMINGLGVLGWGVGGLEAEAVMLGQPIYLATPQVIGFKLYGALRDGVTATDLVLTITQRLRQKGVVEKFVEFYGSGLSAITIPDRATIANMAPEYGATMGFFPTDAETVSYLQRTGRASAAALLERYAKEQALFRTDDTPDPNFTDTLELDLGEVEPCVAGPKKPEQRVALPAVPARWRETLTAPVVKGGYGLMPSALDQKVLLPTSHATLTHGSVVLAAITSCTNTSNPSVLIAAGLLAKNAVEKGLQVKPYVKTSFSPGSQVVTAYLKQTGLLPYLEKLGFYLTGYGCAVCVGNSGPLPAEVSHAIADGELVVAGVLSGNRNFEGRIHPQIRANYLASPPLVVAYAIGGTTELDLQNDPLGFDRAGQPVFLKDIWPSQGDIATALATAISPEMFTQVYAEVFNGDPIWSAMPVSEQALFPWQANSTYLIEPPFLRELTLRRTPVREIRGARVLALLGDGITTDHISPVGHIAHNSPAAEYLLVRGVAVEDFNQYGTRRGNHEVMMRGAFANIRLKNGLLGGAEGGDTLYWPTGERLTIFAAGMKYQQAGVPLLVIAGKEYGMGSSRDWAAKAPALLGVKAILAQSFERIHRSNLVGMGVLPLQFKAGESAEMYGLTGRETYDVDGISENLQPRQLVKVVAATEQTRVEFEVLVRLDTPVEVNYYLNGGIMPTVIRELLRQ